jgi:hypothetical protein
MLPIIQVTVGLIACQRYAAEFNKKALHDISCKALLSLSQYKIGGREGDRTLGPRIANAVLSQLSYSPTCVGIYNLIYQLK